jgi:hypothetical protein
MIISISGFAGSGKDTVGKIIQTLLDFPEMSTEQVIQFSQKQTYNNSFKIKKWADKLKDIVCLLINCTRHQLEDPEFKEKSLGPAWRTWCIWNKVGKEIFANEKEAYERYNKFAAGNAFIIETHHTPRTLMQLIGTECGREIIHPNIWVNSLLSEYITRGESIPYLNGTRGFNIVDESNWIITDTRFKNEFNAIKEVKNFTINVIRGDFNEEMKQFLHISEIDHLSFEYDIKIDNSGTMEELVENVRPVITKILEVYNDRTK